MPMPVMGVRPVGMDVGFLAVVVLVSMGLGRCVVMGVVVVQVVMGVQVRMYRGFVSVQV